MLSLLSSMKKHSVRKTGVTASRVEADSGNSVYTVKLASSPGHSRLLHATLKRWEWPGDEATVKQGT